MAMLALPSALIRTMRARKARAWDIERLEAKLSNCARASCERTIFSLHFLTRGLPKGTPT